MPRVLESVNAVGIGTFVTIVLTVAPATAQCSVTTPVPPIPGGGSLGAWAGPFDWSGQIGYTSVQCTGPTGTFVVPLEENELGHSIYLPSGPHAGKVLFWHFLNWPINSQPIPGCPELKTTQMWLFDPDSPNTLIKVKDPASFTSNIFCSGQSFRADGKLLVVGGYNGATTPPTEVYMFDPWELGVVRIDATGQPFVNTTSNTWTPLADMLLPRYYPIVAPLSPISVALQGGHIVLGGFRFNGALGNYHEWWELMQAAGAHTPPANQWELPVVPDVSDGKQHDLVPPAPAPRYDRYEPGPGPKGSRKNKFTDSSAIPAA